MPKTFYPHEKNFFAPSLCDLLNPIHAIPGGLPLLLARGNKPLELSFEQQLNALVYFHLEEHTSGCHLIQSIDEDDFAREFVSGSKGIKKSTFFEAKRLPQLIAEVNPIIRGWKNYFAQCGYPQKVFFVMDWFVIDRFYRWAKRLSQRGSKCLIPGMWKILWKKGLEFFVTQSAGTVKGTL